MNISNLKIILFPLLAQILFVNAQVPLPSYTRTMLKVARSLPWQTEELKVRTSEGNIATLIVKKHQGRSGSLERTNLPSDKTVPALLTRALDVFPNSENLTNVNEANSAEKVGENEPTFFKLETQAPQNGDSKIDYGSWTALDIDGKAVDDLTTTTEHYLNWKPLPTQTKSAETEDPIKKDSLLLARNFQTRKEKGFNFDTDKSEERFAVFAYDPKPKIRTNIGANLGKNRGGKNVPAEVIVRSEINVKNSAKRMPMTIDSDGTPVIHGMRVPDDPTDKTWRNARVINNQLVLGKVNGDDTSTPTDSSSGNVVESHKFERFFENVNRRYGRNFDDDQQRNVYFEWDPQSNHRNTGLKAEIYDTRDENYRSNIQKRMLHPEGTQTYPVSQMYTPESQKIAPLALKPGARAPVLQYAHPELGVQPAKILKSERRRPDNFPENQNSFTEQRHKKKYVLNDKTIVDTYNTKNYYPNHQFYGLKQQQYVEPSFWIKMKNQFSTGVERVSQLTKPVIDPLVEATQKISQNLGLSRNQEAQDKIGTAVSGSSILIPALGLVASGAALGIGAVAVGRYLDVDVLKRSIENSENPEMQRSFLISPSDNIDFDKSMGSIYYPEHTSTDIPNSENFQVSTREKDGGFLVAAEETHEEVNYPYDDERKFEFREQRRLDGIHSSEIQADDLTMAQTSQKTSPVPILEVVEYDGPPSTGEENSVSKINGKIYNNLSAKDNSQRRRRSLDNIDINEQGMEDTFQNLEHIKLPEAMNNIHGDWSHTLCAKKMFCDAMLQQGLDSYTMMEKKMESYFKLITVPGGAQQVFNHFQEVMEAVRRHDCSMFSCPPSRPGIVY